MYIYQWCWNNQIELLSQMGEAMSLREEERAGRSLKLLLVEDDADYAGLLKVLLSQTSDVKLTMTHVEKFEEAFRLIYHNKANFDIILLDLWLPDSKGLDTFIKMKSFMEETPIVVLTALDDEEIALQAVKKGAQDYLLKSQVQGRQLQYAISNAVERHKIRQKLREANRKILDQQKLLLEEERLRILFQLAGGAAHELNQPVTSLLGNIELLKRHKNNQDKKTTYLNRIEGDGQRIASIVKKLKEIRHYEIKPYSGRASIINLDQIINILYVGDSRADYEKLSTLLKGQFHVALTRKERLQEALAALARRDFDLLLLDNVHHDNNSLEQISELIRKSAPTPSVVITTDDNELFATQLIDAGAYDYLTKGEVGKKSLSRSINNALEKARLKKEIKLAMEKLADLSSVDELTGLFNQNYFEGVLERELSRARRYRMSLAICMVNLDQFSEINQIHSPPAGDKVLFEMGHLLQQFIRNSDLVCRYNDGGFAVMLPNTHLEGAQLACARLKDMVAQHDFKYQFENLKITTSTGIASYSKILDQSTEALLKEADFALYRAKRGGRNQIDISPLSLS